MDVLLKEQDCQPDVYMSPECYDTQGDQATSFLHFKSRMEQDNAEAKQVGDQRQSSQKAEPESPKLSDTNKLIEFMESHYNEFVAGAQTFDDFYHAIFELIEKFCEERGQFQYRIPKKRDLEEAYSKHHKSEGDVTKEELVEMGKELFKVESFTLGKATVELAMFLFGAPACAWMAKRVLPGLGWLSDDVVIPLATSGSVAYLIKSKRL